MTCHPEPRSAAERVRDLLLLLLWAIKKAEQIPPLRQNSGSE